MKYLIIDTEGSKLPRISPWHHGSFISSVGRIDSTGEFKVWLFNHVSEQCCDHTAAIADIQAEIDAADILVFHNAKHDLNWFRHIGLSFDDKPVWCTMVAEYILVGQNPDVALNLDACADRYALGSKGDKMKEFWEAGHETDTIPWHIHKEYLEQDVKLTLQLFLKQLPLIDKYNLRKVADVSFEITKMLSDMEVTGIAFDIEGAKKYVKEYAEQVAAIDKELCRILGSPFKPGSSQQLAAALYGGHFKREVQELVARPRKDGTFRVYSRKADYLQPVTGMGFIPDSRTVSTKTGAYSTGKNVVEFLKGKTQQQKEFIKILNQRRAAAKVYSTLWSDKDSNAGLINKVGNDGRIHPNFNQCVTRTGRLSSSDPNGQNLPREGTSPLKKLFFATLGYLINGDLSQVEWRAGAGLSDDTIMIQEIVDGVDIHTDTGVRFFGGDPESPRFKKDVRNPSKTFNFRMIYDGKAQSFFFDNRMPDFSLKKWKDIVLGFWDKYSMLRAWQLRNERVVNNQGFLVQPHGRILTFRFYEEGQHEYKTGYWRTEICNYPVQSICGDFMFLTMLIIYKKCKKLKLKTQFLLQVHDSLVCDSPEEEVSTVAQLMMDTFKNLRQSFLDYYGWDIGVPLTGEVAIGKNYGEMPHEFKEENISDKAILEAIDKLKADTTYGKA